MYPLTEEQRTVAQLAREFARTQVAGRRQEIDEQDEFPTDLVRQMHELGLVGMCLPEAYGGVGADHVTYSLVIEELAVAAPVLANINMVQKCYSEFIYRAGSEALKKRWVREIAAGRKHVAIAMTEPHTGSDAAAIKTVAVRTGDHYVINGQKQFITMAGVADVAVVFAKTNPDAGHKGISAFLVEADRPGYAITGKEKLLGMRGEETGSLAFVDVRVPAANMLGEEGEGFKLCMYSFDTGRLVIGSLALGIARAALEASVRYAREREAFGRRIAEFQGVAFPIADMYARLEAARLVLHKAAVKKDLGLNFALEASMGKLLASDLAMQAATDAVQIHGGMGYSMELPVQQMMRDAKLTQIYEGTNQIQRMIISRQLLKQLDPLAAAQ